MADAESPVDVVQTLFALLPSAPKRICFDNACNLHTAVLNRCPVHFKDTDFVVDKMHYKGHKNCSAAYDAGKLGSI
jgi:hypothetical protein